MNEKDGRHRESHSADISMIREGEVKYWAAHFGVPEEELQEAVDTVGENAAAVREYLRR
ncbi:DUF3606 domain-containing protein [Novosphingobium terrae]|uniref:DUF3606 domain-containing protein n=1 Tax=Novosphingobium terrae TaxID=2726189 RepID=UPI00197F65A3|nr:DUF3606 domain-containing protein [Novosphingobium terrae]